LEFLENYPEKDLPPPNSHVFWREAPTSLRRNYRVHLYYPSGKYGEGKAAFVYWKTVTQRWHILSHGERQKYLNWGEPLPEVEEFNYPLGEVPSNFAFEDHDRSNSASTSDEEGSSSQTQSSPRSRSNTLD
jgi:hypothetical protein